MTEIRVGRPLFLKPQPHGSNQEQPGIECCFALGRFKAHPFRMQFLLNGPEERERRRTSYEAEYALIDNLGRGRVRRRQPLKLIIFLLLAGMLLACGVRGFPRPAHLFQRDQPVEIELTNYSFKPNHLVVLGNESPVRFLLKNTDGVVHNFTLMAPGRNIILSEDVKPRVAITVDTEFLKSGNYAFYCFHHQYRGMEGMLMMIRLLSG